METQLKRLDKVIYMDHGSSDEEGYQIFTPEFIVTGMIDAIGRKEVLDFTKTILEPTSGDGAFTCRILLMRLKMIKDKYAVNALRALSTIYSIEMDEELIIKQRNNIYTIMCDYADKKKIKDEKFFKCLADIIKNNFIWGMTNTDYDPSENIPSLFKLEETNTNNFIAYRMPVTKSEEQPVKFYSWKINDDLSYSSNEEEIEA